MINCTISHTWVVIGVAVTTIRVIGVVVTRLVGSGSANFLRHLEYYLFLFRVFSGQRFRLEWLSSNNSQLRLKRKWSNHVVTWCADYSCRMSSTHSQKDSVKESALHSPALPFITEQDPSDSHLDVQTKTLAPKLGRITSSMFRHLWHSCCLRRVSRLESTILSIISLSP